VRQRNVLSPILFNFIMNDVCNKIKEEMEVSDLKALIYAEDIMILGDVKDPEI
jgi:hypothetical protein